MSLFVLRFFLIADVIIWRDWICKNNHTEDGSGDITMWSALVAHSTTPPYTGLASTKFQGPDWGHAEDSQHVQVGVKNVKQTDNLLDSENVYISTSWGISVATSFTVD